MAEGLVEKEFESNGDGHAVSGKLTDKEVQLEVTGHGGVTETIDLTADEAERLAAWLQQAVVWIRAQQRPGAVTVAGCCFTYSPAFSHPVAYVHDPKA